MPNLKTEIVRRSDRAKGFVPLPKRWIVERTIAWLNELLPSTSQGLGESSQRTLPQTRFHPPQVAKAMQHGLNAGAGKFLE
jgi:hypothetical protein